MKLKGTAGVLLIALLAVVACSKGERSVRIQPQDTPAPPGSVFPSLVAAEGRVLLSWTEPAGDEIEARVRFAELNGDAWSAAETIAEGDLFVNWADFASLNLAADGTLVRGMEFGAPLTAVSLLEPETGEAAVAESHGGASLVAVLRWR